MSDNAFIFIVLYVALVGCLATFLFLRKVCEVLLFGFIITWIAYAAAWDKHLRHSNLTKVALLYVATSIYMAWKRAFDPYMIQVDCYESKNWIFRPPFSLKRKSK